MGVASVGTAEISAFRLQRMEVLHRCSFRSDNFELLQQRQLYCSGLAIFDRSMSPGA